MDVQESKNKSMVEEKKNWTVRPMRFVDIEKCLLIWNRAELTEAYDTVASCLAADQDGFYVAELSDSGEVVGMCTANLVKPGLAFVGFYGVDSSYRGIGIGRELWSKCFERFDLDQSINIGLYSIPSMNEKYKKIGFTLEDSTKMLVYESERNNDKNLNINLLKSLDDLPTDCRLELINKNTSKCIKKSLVEYDESVQTFSREKLLNLYLFNEDNVLNKTPLAFAIVRTETTTSGGDNYLPEQTTESSLVYKPHSNHHNALDPVERKSSCCARPPTSQEAIIEDETLSTATKNSLSISASSLGDLPSPLVSLAETSNQSLERLSSQPQQNREVVLGYGVIRYDNNSGGIIGPIYADSSEYCEIILRTLIENFNLTKGSIYSLMALDSNMEACKLMEKVGFKEIDQCTRIFTKQIPTALFEKVFFVHSPNFTIV